MSQVSFEHNTPSPSQQQIEEYERDRKCRPSFSSQKTNDRIRESDRRPSIPSSVRSKSQTLRRSVFREEGLDDLNTSVHIIRDGEQTILPGTGHEDIRKQRLEVGSGGDGNGKATVPKPGGFFSKLGKASGPGLGSRATTPSPNAPPPPAFATLPRAALIILLVAMVVPGFRYSGSERVIIAGADADVIRTSEMVENGSLIEGRAASPTAVCTRWAHQVANVNGTIYIYGGQAKQKSGQTSNTWNNNLLTLDLTTTWNRASPSLSGLTQPSGPPAVSLGTLWHSYDSLFLYGGEFSDNPSTSPLPVSTWQYNIKSALWTEWKDPLTSAGNHSAEGQQPVQRSAEGAGLSIPELGKSWYFGGHLDMYTTAGWSNQIARVYLKSLLEFTHPGYANSGIYGLGTTVAAGNGGAYRNITQGGLQDEAGFTERADGVLVYIPGWGEEGIILGLAGGTNETFTEMNIIDIYDVANSTWYKQATSGPNPPIRVNPCAVVAAAPDGTSFNVYLYGGQNLIPYSEQVQYSDMWILTVPSFTWTQVVMDGQSQPPARAGHTCTMWDGQIVVVGGYVGKDISCDSPGIYVFNASSLQWTSGFTAISGPSSTNNDQGSSVLQGSHGYQVPAQVQSIIGGSSAGGATASTPAAGAATIGPFATGRSPVFTITQSGTTITQTGFPTSTSKSSPTISSDSQKSTNTGAVAAGVIAGVLACIAGYLAFCTWLYRRQIAMYQNHVKMAQRTSFGVDPNGEWSSEIHTDVGGSGAGILLSPARTKIGRGAEGSPGRSSGSDQGTGDPAPRSDRRYDRIDEHSPNHEPRGDTNYLEAGTSDNMNDGGRATGHSRQTSGASLMGQSSVGSQDDLLGGQEPSFFSVVLNPRRTLRVVNMD